MKNTITLLTTTLISVMFMTASVNAANKSDAGTSAGAFMRLGLGAPKAQALGHAHTALTSGTEALAWNPSGIASTTQSTLGYSFMSWVQDYKGHYLAFLQPVGTAVVGVNIGYMSDDKFDARDSDGKHVSDEIKVQDSFITLGVAHSFFTETLSLGAAIKRVAEDNDGSTYSNIVFDVGAQLKFGKFLALGAAQQNMGDNEEVVGITRLGASLTPLSFLTLSAEYEIPGDNKGRFGFGVEFFLDEDIIQVGKIALRIGYLDNDKMGKNRDEDWLDDLGIADSSKLSFGVGLYTAQLLGYGVGLDYAMSSLGSLGITHQFSIFVEF